MFDAGLQWRWNAFTFWIFWSNWCFWQSSCKQQGSYLSGYFTLNMLTLPFVYELFSFQTNLLGTQFSFLSLICRPSILKFYTLYKPVTSWLLVLRTWNLVILKSKSSLQACVELVAEIMNLYPVNIETEL